MLTGCFNFTGQPTRGTPRTWYLIDSAEVAAWFNRHWETGGRVAGVRGGVTGSKGAATTRITGGSADLVAQFFARPLVRAGRRSVAGIEINDLRICVRVIGQAFFAASTASGSVSKPTAALPEIRSSKGIGASCGVSSLGSKQADWAIFQSDRTGFHYPIQSAENRAASGRRQEPRAAGPGAHGRHAITSQIRKAAQLQRSRRRPESQPLPARPCLPRLPPLPGRPDDPAHHLGAAAPVPLPVPKRVHTWVYVWRYHLQPALVRCQVLPS